VKADGTGHRREGDDEFIFHGSFDFKDGGY
jgi:hypothetical protein